MELQVGPHALQYTLRQQGGAVALPRRGVRLDVRAAVLLLPLLLWGLRREAWMLKIIQGSKYPTHVLFCLKPTRLSM